MLLEATCVTIHTYVLELPLEYNILDDRYMHLSRRISCASLVMDLTQQKVYVHMCCWLRGAGD